MKIESLEEFREYKGAGPVELYLQGQRCLGDEGAAELAKLLQEDGRGEVVGLWLSSNRIGDEGAGKLAVALANGACLELTELDLSDNQIGAPGGTAIADALKVNTTLQKLNLYGVRFSCRHVSSSVASCVVSSSPPGVFRSSSCVASVPGARLLRR